MHVPVTRGVVVLTALVLSSCETMTTAPAGLPRVELEVTVNVREGYSGKLMVAGPELTRAVADVVLARSDLGLRFYPVLSTQYGPKDPRPEYQLTVDVLDLALHIDHRTTRVEGSEPQITPVITQLDSSIAATLMRRRPVGPPLVVGRAEGKGLTSVETSSAPGTKETYAVTRDGKQPRNVGRDVVLQVTDRGVTQALTALVGPVDRELALRAAAPSTPAPQPAR